jgi:hypothetical protein
VTGGTTQTRRSPDCVKHNLIHELGTPRRKITT